MMYLQELAASHTHVPVFMSSLLQLPTLMGSFSNASQIIIVSANGKSLKSMETLIAKQCNVEISDQRFVIVGAENVPGFEAVANC